MSGDPSDSSDGVPRDAISGVTPFSPDGDRPSDPKVKELINAVVEALKMDQKVQKEWREQIAFNVAAAKSRIAFGARMPKPGDMKRKAARLRVTLEKARCFPRKSSRCFRRCYLSSPTTITSKTTKLIRLSWSTPFAPLR